MRDIAAFAACCVMAAMAPLWPSEATTTPPSASWDAALVPARARVLALSREEQDHYARFPGSVARYVLDGEVVLVRRVKGASRALHGSAECLRAAGWTVTPSPTRVDEQGHAWSAGTAHRSDESIHYRERIECSDGSAFQDVGGWYWHALLSDGDVTCTAETRSR